MANRFWVGGAGTWDGSTTTNWSTTTGGAGGASVPTNTDDVFLDGNSGAGIITLGAATVPMKSITCTGFTGTLNIANGTQLRVGTNGVNQASSVTFVAGMTITGTGTILCDLFSGQTGTFTTAGRLAVPAISTVQFQGGGTWTLSDAMVLNIGTTLNLNAGTLDTNGLNHTWGLLSSSSANTRTLTLGASTITISSSANPAWDMSIPTNLTVNAGTSTIIFSQAAKIAPGGKTYNSIIMNSSACYMSGSVTCANFTINGTAIKNFQFDFDSNWTVTGTLSILANSATSRIWFGSHTIGSQVQVTAATLTCTGVIDFHDCKGAGTATWSAVASGATAFGDCLGNSTITFDASVPQAWQGTSGGNWSDITKWTSRVPLPQDDITFPVAFTAAQTVVADMPRMGRSIDFSGCSGSPTFQYGPANMINYGAWNFTGIGTITNGGNTTHLILNARTAINLTTGGTQLPPGGGNDVLIQLPTGTLNLRDNLSWLCTFVMNAGTLNTNNFNLSSYGFQFNAFLACTVNCGSSTFSVVGSTGLWQVTGGVTFNAQTSTIQFPISPGTNVQQFQGGGFSYNIVRNINAGTGGFTITGNNTFNVLEIQALASRTLTLPASGTQTIKQVCAIYASGGQTISVVSSTPTTATTITLQANNALPQFWNHSFSGDITVTLPTKIRYWVGGIATWDTSTTTHWSASSGGAGGASVPDSTTVVVFDANSGLTAAGAPNGVIQINNNVTCGGLALGGLTGKNFQLRVSNSAGGPTFAAGNYSFMGADEWTPCCIPSNTIGVTSTFTINGTHALHKWVHFRDIAMAGSAGTLSGTLIGDMLGNSGITFEPSVTQTWQGTVSGNWSDPTKWSSRVPLPQDDVIIKSGFSASQTITLDMSRIGRNIDFTGTTGSPAFSKSGANGATQYMFGSLTSAPGVSMPGGNTFVFGGRGQHTLTLMNMAWGFTITFQAPGATYKMMGHMLQSASGTFSIDAGTWDFNGFNMNIRSGGSVSAATSSWVSAIILGSGTHRFGGNAVGSAIAVNSTNSFLTGNNGGTIIFESQGSNFTIASNTPGSNIDLSKETLIFYDTSPVGATMTISATTNVHIGGIIYRTPGRGNLSILGVNLTIDTLDIESSGTLTLSATRTYNINNLLLRGWGQGNESVGPPLNVVSSAPGTGVTVNVTGILEKSNVTFTADVPINQTGTLVGYQKSPNSFDYFNNPGFDQNQQNLFFPVSYFTGEVFGVLMAPTTTTWNFDYFLANGEPISVLERYGLPYTEANSIRSVSGLSVGIDIHTTFDSNTVASKTTPSGVDTKQSVDSGTVRTPSRISITDIQGFIEAATARSKTTVTATDFQQFVEAQIIRSIARLSVADIDARIDAATIRALTTFVGVSIHERYDAATIRSIAQLSIIKQMPLALLSAILWARWSDSSFYSKWSANCNNIL